MNGNYLLNIISQIISTALVYVTFSINHMPWKTWQKVLGALLTALAVNMASNIATIFMAPLFQINIIVSLLISAVLMTLIGWPIFALLRANGHFVGTRKGFACAASYAVMSLMFFVIKGFLL